MAREPIEHVSPRALEIVAGLARERDALEAGIVTVIAERDRAILARDAAAAVHADVVADLRARLASALARLTSARARLEPEPGPASVEGERYTVDTARADLGIERS